MAHFLTTNWTEKIKTNPVANMILNSNRPKTYDVILYELMYHPPAGKKMTYKFMNQFKDKVTRYTLNEKEFERFSKVYPSFKNRKDAYNNLVEAQLKQQAAEDGIDAGIAGGGGGDDDVGIVAVHGGNAADNGQGDGAANDDGEAIVVDDENEEEIYTYDNVEQINPQDLDKQDYIYEYDEHIGGDMWANVFVNDYINIHHPKLRYDYVSAMTGKPLQIKPPSVFFSDV